ncbi:MAG: twin-arginine translocation signal domain-containing protein [Proteobacteria bacterium]|nr:twin-arginine translocation signal domain-containing protein [Pseudomonadota bacterium]
MNNYFSRRSFVKSGLAVGAAASVAAVASTSKNAANDPLGLRLPIHLALFDTRFPAAHAFARALAIRGVTLAPYDGDVTPVWFNQLDPVWRQYPLAVAGLTTEGALFCLEQLAWDNRMRVVYRGLHESSAQGGTRHVLQSSARRPQDVHGRLSGVQPWPAQIAELIAGIDEPVAAFPSDAAQRSQAEYRTRSRMTGQRLVSWLIAPKDWRAPAAVSAATSAAAAS